MPRVAKKTGKVVIVDSCEGFIPRTLVRETIALLSKLCLLGPWRGFPLFHNRMLAALGCLFIRAFEGLACRGYPCFDLLGLLERNGLRLKKEVPVLIGFARISLYQK